MADLADKLLQIAARRSTETQFGWAHPDCEALEDAARILKGDPPADGNENEGCVSAEPGEVPGAGQS